MPSDGSRTLWCRLDVQSISLYVGGTGVLPCSPCSLCVRGWWIVGPDAAGGFWREIASGK